MQMLRWAQGLQEAGKRRDWRALRRLDGEVAGALGQWSDASGWSAAERGALQRLAQAHGAARLACENELQTLDETLHRMREGRDRWLAYAASAGWQDEESLA